MTDDKQAEALRLARLRVQTARRTVLFFLIFGTVWVIATDLLAKAILAESPLWDQFQTLKGLVFVTLSCVLIYVSIIRHAEQVLASEATSQDRLRHTEMEFRTMVETMAEGVCTLDVDNRLLYANRRFCEITGFRYSEIVRADLFEVLSASSQPHELIKSGRSELVIRTRSGHQKLVSVHVVDRHDDRQRPIGALCVIDDLTELRRSEAERERLHTQIEQMKRIESLGKLSGTMAHEFNNVMAGILPFTEVIERVAEDERIISATGYIKQAVRRGQRVSQEVLRFARPMPLARRRVTVADLLERVEVAGGSLLGARHQLQVLASSDDAVEIDLEQIEQVLTNLLINAGEAMGEGGTVVLSARRDPARTTYEFGVVPHPENFVHLSVQDDGCGIPEEVLRRVFEPFVTTKRRGTGLGLAITYQIVANHHGHIFAESTEGEGTTMHLFLPVSHRPEGPPDDQEESS